MRSPIFLHFGVDMKLTQNNGVAPVLGLGQLTYSVFSLRPSFLSIPNPHPGWLWVWSETLQAQSLLVQGLYRESSLFADRGEGREARQWLLWPLSFWVCVPTFCLTQAGMRASRQSATAMKVMRETTSGGLWKPFFRCPSRQGIGKPCECVCVSVNERMCSYVPVCVCVHENLCVHVYVCLYLYMYLHTYM